MDDASGLHLPLRRLEGIVLARIAGGIDAVLEHRDVAALTVGAGGGESGLLGHIEAERVDEAVAHVVAKIQDLAVGDLAVGLAQPHVAFGMQTLGALVIDDPVALKT